MCRADLQKKEYIMTCVEAMVELGIPIRITRDYVTVSFWPRLAEVAPAGEVARQIETLRDPGKLGGEMPIPSVSRDNRHYCSDGSYRRGGVRLPTSYMTIKSLEKYGEFELAAELAERTIAGMAKVYRDCEPHTIHEACAPEGVAPAMTRDGEPVRIDFCGWSALGPIALLIENVIGIHSVDDRTMTVTLFVPGNRDCTV